jgi:hypothetical protein
MPEIICDASENRKHLPWVKIKHAHDSGLVDNQPDGVYSMNDAQAAADDKIKRAFARLSSIRRNLPDTVAIDEPLAKEYAAALLHLEELGFDVEEFKIPEDWMYHPWVNHNSMTGKTTYSERRVLKRSLFVMKLDAVLGYFTTTASKDTIGFRNTC